MLAVSVVTLALTVLSVTVNDCRFDQIAFAGKPFWVITLIGLTFIKDCFWMVVDFVTLL